LRRSGTVSQGLAVALSDSIESRSHHTDDLSDPPTDRPTGPSLCSVRCGFFSDRVSPTTSLVACRRRILSAARSYVSPPRRPPSVDRASCCTFALLDRKWFECPRDRIAATRHQHRCFLDRLPTAAFSPLFRAVYLKIFIRHHSYICRYVKKEKYAIRQRNTVKLLIEAPSFYLNKCLTPPACIGDPAYIRDPAFIKT